MTCCVLDILRSLADPLPSQRHLLNVLLTGFWPNRPKNTHIFNLALLYILETHRFPGRTLFPFIRYM
jgi:hypothetical protein